MKYRFSCKIFYILSQLRSTVLTPMFAFITAKSKGNDIFVIHPVFAVLKLVFMRLPKLQNANIHPYVVRFLDRKIRGRRYIYRLPLFCCSKVSLYVCSSSLKSGQAPLYSAAFLPTPLRDPLSVFYGLSHGSSLPVLLRRFGLELLQRGQNARPEAPRLFDQDSNRLFQDPDEPGRILPMLFCML